MTAAHGKLLRTFGATIEEIVIPDPATGELLWTCGLADSRSSRFFRILAEQLRR